MYSVSDRYKEAVYAPTRTAKARVTFDISDVTAAGDVTNITTTGQFILSNKEQLINKNREQYNFASFEPDRFKLDGSFMFADEEIANNGELGFISDELCGADGIFSTPVTLAFEFGSVHSSMGLTITFDAGAGEYATDFNVTAYDAENNVIDSVNVTGNTQVQCTPTGQLYQYKKIVVIITRWCKPYRRARIAEVDFGVVRVYQDNNLIKASLIEEMDIITSTLPSPEFKFTVDNSSREFNILNPSGIYKYLQERQQVISEIGIDKGGLIEYIQLGNYLLTEWFSDEGALTATFTARTNLDLMSGFDYENLVDKSNYNLYQMAVEIINLCGITNYYLDPGLQSISTKGLVKKTNCRDILQMIAIAGCANIFITRDNVITIKISPEALDNSIDNINLDNMFQEAQIELDKIVKTVQVTYYSDLDTSAVVSVNNPGIDKGDVLKLENNTLINAEEQATAVANWILQQKNYRAKYNINWRGNPAHELNDVLTIETTYGTAKKAIITKNNLEYHGYLSAVTEARGSSDAVD
ncbi:MAG: hypothetical protein ACOYBE_13280 [Blautia sp.]|jgi:hypothetical protein